MQQGDVPSISLDMTGSAVAQPWQPWHPWQSAHEGASRSPERASRGGRRTTGGASNPGSVLTPLLRTGLREPNTITAAVVLATAVVLLARHPIARVLGTEVDHRPATGLTALHAPVPQHAWTVPALPLAPVPTHAPRDPFRAQTGPSGPARAGTGPAGIASAGIATAAGPSCSGTPHRVRAGESLWSIAARTVRTGDTARLTVAWHRLYALNRPPLGSDPSLLQTGTVLCIPSQL